MSFILKCQSGCTILVCYFGTGITWIVVAIRRGALSCLRFRGLFPRCTPGFLCPGLSSNSNVHILSLTLHDAFDSYSIYQASKSVSRNFTRRIPALQGWRILCYCHAVTRAFLLVLRLADRPTGRYTDIKTDRNTIYSI